MEKTCLTMVFTVTMHWASEKDADACVSIFKDFDKANEYFHRLIEEEKYVSNEWDSGLFDHKGNLIPEEAFDITYDVREVTKESITMANYGYWKISDKYGNFTYIYLRTEILE